jgi:hypothetical protein
MTRLCPCLAALVVPLTFGCTPDWDRPLFNQTVELALGISTDTNAPEGSYYFDNVTVP